MDSFTPLSNWLSSLAKMSTQLSSKEWFYTSTLFDWLHLFLSLSLWNRNQKHFTQSVTPFICRLLSASVPQYRRLMDASQMLTYCFLNALYYEMFLCLLLLLWLDLWLLLSWPGLTGKRDLHTHVPSWIQITYFDSLIWDAWAIWVQRPCFSPAHMFWSKCSWMISNGSECSWFHL